MTASEPQRERRGRGERPERRVQAGGRTIIVARSAGYCYGVERALQIADDAVEHSEKPIATLGPIIHNPSVVEQLARRGAAVVDEVAQLESGTVVVRTHGVPPAVIEEARRRGLTVVDATCPFVTVAQRKAAALQAAGYTVVILGERDHPEVIGLSACAGEQAVVVEDPGELQAASVRGRRVGVVVQTTQSYTNLARLAQVLAPLAREMLIYNTICEATEQRQAAAREVAATVDVVLVVGGRNSANTRRLAALCRELQARTYHIERAEEIDAAWFAGTERVGITAGASTPDEEIDGAVEAVVRIVAQG
jgi:4-hydroxy-3-methylbut-2-enyl diphosphate reductase